MKLKDTFDKFNETDEHGKFERVENKLSSRPDLHAFILLNQIVPGTSRMISAAEHDEYFLDVEIDALEIAGITEAQVLELIRCSVRYDEDNDCLALFA